jgi:hypothetical protein
MLVTLEALGAILLALVVGQTCIFFATSAFTNARSFHAIAQSPARRNAGKKKRDQ